VPELQPRGLLRLSHTHELSANTSLHQRHDNDEGTVFLMADIEGNEFCLVRYV
jgi:hypothetical protein